MSSVYFNFLWCLVSWNRASLLLCPELSFSYRTPIAPKRKVWTRQHHLQLSLQLRYITGTVLGIWSIISSNTNGRSWSSSELLSSLIFFVNCQVKPKNRETCFFIHRVDRWWILSRIFSWKSMTSNVCSHNFPFDDISFGKNNCFPCSIMSFFTASLLMDIFWTPHPLWSLHVYNNQHDYHNATTPIVLHACLLLHAY